MLVIPLSPIFQLFLLCSQRFTISLMKKKQRKNKLAHKSVGLSLLQMGVRSRADSGRGGEGRRFGAPAAARRQAAIRCSGSGPAPGGGGAWVPDPNAQQQTDMTYVFICSTFIFWYYHQHLYCILHLYSDINDLDLINIVNINIVISMFMFNQ